MERDRFRLKRRNEDMDCACPRPPIPARLEQSFVSSFPVDPSLPIWSGNVDWDLEIAADVPTRNGKTAKFKLISKQTTEVAQKPVK
jgi:hypothetical protein